MAPADISVTPFRLDPLNNIQPFTYRDSTSHMAMLEKLRVYINESMRPEFNQEMQRILDDFQEGVTASESRFDEFVSAVNAAVMLINNRVGPESIHRVTLTADYTLTIDPDWPNAHPIRFQFTQDAAGDHYVDFGPGVVGSALVDLALLAETEVELVPDGAGSWMVRTLNKPQVIDVAKEFGARPGGVFDNTVKFNAVMDEARASHREVFIPAGVWYVSGEVNISGVTIRGVVHGYQNGSGSILRGNGSYIIFNQQDVSPVAQIRSGVHGIRFENCNTGLRVSYSVYSQYSDLTIVDANADALIVGDVTIIGPLWNIFNRVTAISVNGYGLRLAGKDWCNSNIFDSCYFKGTTGVVNVLSSGGFGSLDNTFFNTEIRNDVGPGIVFNGTNRATTLEKCFFESKGPSVVVNNPTADLQMQGNVYGSVRNNIVGYGPYIIHHKANTFSVRIIGGWITTNPSPDQDNLRFIGSDNVPGLTLDYIVEPSTTGIQSNGYKIHDETVISAAPRTHRGDVNIRKYLAPSFTIGYADGTKIFQIKRNGTQGGSDLGVDFISDGTKGLTLLNNGILIHWGHLATDKAIPATVPGTLAYRIPVYNSAQVAIGNIEVKTGTV